MRFLLIRYAALVGFIIAIDRITKYLIFHQEDAISVTSFLTFEKTFNRGISWGFLGQSSPTVFVLITVAIAFFCLSLGLYSFVRLKAGQSISAELLVLAGGVSNLADRLIYCGVIDFIAVTIGGWQFPVFNIADCAIVIGAFVMLYQGFKESA